MLSEEQIIEMSMNPTMDVIRDSYNLCRQRLHQYITNRVIALDKEFGNEVHCDIVLDEGQGLAECVKTRCTDVILDPVSGEIMITLDDGFSYNLADESMETMLKIAEGLC